MLVVGWGSEQGEWRLALTSRYGRGLLLGQLVLLGLLCLLILCATWLVLRGAAGEPRGSVAWHAPRGRHEIAAGALLVLVSSLPLLFVAPWTHGSAHFFPADAASHAKVALEIAREGLPHGWLESYLGGFPFGHHYPPLGWLLLALGMRAGLAAGTAVNSLGFIATLAAPMALYAACVRAGARPIHAACAGCMLSLVSPYNPFVGGFEVYFTIGLLSQAVALPLCIGFAAAVARGARAEAALLGALSMSAHPQLCSACIVLIGIVASLDGARGRRGAVACALGASVLAGAALYGQGLQTLRVPFGWPPGITWRQLGFGAARLVWWFRDGDLLDKDSHVPALTSLALASALTCALLFERRAARALLLLALAGVAVSSSGRALATLPKWGPLLLEFAQPLRALALVAPIFAALLAVALEEGIARLRGVAPPGPGKLRQLTTLTAVAVSLCALGLAVPARMRAARQLRELRAGSAAGRCVGVLGFDRAKLSSWFHSLRGGSLWFDQREAQPLATCLESQGLELESRAPIGNTSAVGSHVGLLWVAAKQLQPERAGAAGRAQALGIGYVIRVASAGAAPLPGFARREVSGQVELLEVAGAGRAHLGCVRERWSGSDRALRERLTRELSTAQGADHLLEPERFVELVQGQGDVTVARVDRECDATHATLDVAEREPGALEAVLESDAPVDLAFSATAFPTWRVSVDGAPGVPAGMIAPGYVYVHIGRGRHRIVATVSSMSGYGVWLGLAGLGVAALAWLDVRRLRAVWRLSPAVANKGRV
jgi:hypothetical protein